MFNVYRQILSLHLGEWCITFVFRCYKHYTDLLVKNSHNKVKLYGI